MIDSYYMNHILRKVSIISIISKTIGTIVKDQVDSLQAES